jgi:hypothetical protein
MALFLSSSQSSVLEPIRKNRWIMQFTRVPGNLNDNGPTKLAFTAHSASQPKLTTSEQTTNRLNERFYTAGRPEWNPITVEFYDYIDGVDSAGHILWEWATSIYNPVTGQMFFKSQYTTSATLALLDPAGGVIRVWNLFYCFPTEVNWGDGLSADSDDINSVSVNFRYDYAVKGTDVDTSPGA